MVGSLVAAAVAAILTRTDDTRPPKPDGKRLPEENESEDA
jgi:hypothetical protein